MTRYDRSRQSAHEASIKADKLYDSADQMSNYGKGGYYADAAHRYAVASDYLEKRSDRDRQGYKDIHDKQERKEPTHKD